MGFDRPDEPIRTAAWHRQEAERWKRQQRRGRGGDRRAGADRKRGARVAPELAVPVEQLAKEEAERQAAQETKAKPQPYRVEPSWKATERDAKGNVTVYVDQQGVRHYTPHSTMWRMGYRTSKEYRRTGAVREHPVSAAPWVAVRDAAGQPVHISKDEATRLARLAGKPKSQFNLMKSLGLLPGTAQFVPSEDKSNPANWRYYYKGQAKVRPIKARTDTERADLLGEYAAFQGAKSKLALYTNTKGEVDIAKYLRDHPGQVGTLYAAGFTGPQVQKAIDYNHQYLGTETPKYKTIEEYAQGYFKKKGWKWKVTTLSPPAEQKLFQKRLQAVRKEYNETYRPPMAMEQFLQNYFTEKGWAYTPLAGVREPPKVTAQFTTSIHPEVVKFNKRYDEAMAAYKAKYGTRAVVQTKVGEVASFAFVPARALKPEVELKHISGMEWGIGAAQVALLTAPFVAAPLRTAGAATKAMLAAGRDAVSPYYTATVLGTRGAAGLMFTAATVKDWDNLSESGKFWAVAIDLAIIGSAVYKPVGIAGKWIGKHTPAPPEAYPAYIRFGSTEANAAIKDISRAMATNDERLLVQAARRLEMAAAKMPKQIGGDYLAERARLIAGNPKAYLELGRTKLTPAETRMVKDSLDANKAFIRNAEAQLRNVRSTARRQSIEQVLTEARRQVKVATKVKVQPLIEVDMFERVAGKFPLAKRMTKALTVRGKPKPRPSVKPTEKASVFPGIKVKKLDVAYQGKEYAIPMEAFGRMTYAQIAKEYGINVGAITLAVSRAAPNVRQAIEYLQAQRPGHKPISAIYPSERTQPAETIATKLQPKEQPKPKEKPIVAPYPAQQVRPIPEPRPEPMPEPGMPQKPPAEVITEKDTSKPIVLPAGASEKEIREYVKKIPGTVAWNMGKLGPKNPKDVWHIRLPTGRHLVVLGKAPEGVKILADGPGSAGKTTQVIGTRRPFKPFSQVHGAVTATISPARIPKGARIRFSERTGLRSVRRGKIYHTRSGGTTLLSRHPLGRRRR